MRTPATSVPKYVDQPKHLVAMQRPGVPCPLGNTIAATGRLPADQASLDHLRPSEHNSGIAAVALIDLRCEA